MRRSLLPVLLAAALATVDSSSAARATVGNPHAADTFTLAVYGDAPYGTSPSDTSELQATPAFIDAINADPHVRLVLHVGDIHSGKQYCTAEYDRTVATLWSRFRDPLVYTPGDNEWADCHKPAEGGGTWNATTQQVDVSRGTDGAPLGYAGGDPVANLALVRQLFFPRPGQALGGRSMQVISQAEFNDAAHHPADAAFVENVMFVRSGVLFVVVNMPGGSNNDEDIWYGAPRMSQRQADEIANRSGATLRWLDQAFDLARHDRNIRAVAIVAQADMWDPEKGAAHQSGYEPFVRAIATQAGALQRPVLMLNGDSHEYQSGNPMSPADAGYAMHPGYDVPNFHRIVVHGSTFPLEYLRLTIDPRANAANGADAFGPFRWERVVR
jgi:hypothetical protein